MAKSDDAFREPYRLASMAATNVIDSLRNYGDGVVVSVRVSRIKRDADITKPSLHEVLAVAEAQHMEPLP